MFKWMENWKNQGYWWLVGIATTILWYHLDLSISRGNNWTFMVAYLSSSIPWLFWISPGLACLMFGLQVKCHPLIGYLMYQFLGDGFTYFYFHPETWGRFPIWLIFFQMGWFNHQSGLFLASFGCIGTWAGCSSPMKFGQSSPLSSAHYPCLLRCCASSQSQEWRRWCRKLVRLRCKANNPLYLGMFEPWVVVSNIFNFHPYLGKWSNLTNIFQMGWNHQLEPLFPIQVGCRKVQGGDWPPGRLGGWAAASIYSVASKRRPTGSWYVRKIGCTSPWSTVATMQLDWYTCLLHLIDVW